VSSQGCTPAQTYHSYTQQFGSKSSLEGIHVLRPELIDEVSFSGPRDVVEPLSNRAKDKLMTIAQRVLHQALDRFSTRPCLDQDDTNLKAKLSGFNALPSSETLGNYLAFYMSRCESYYGLTPACSSNPSTLILESNNESVTEVLILLMIAHGAQLMQSPEAIAFSRTLTEICQITLEDLESMRSVGSGSAGILHSCFHLLQLTAWSGDLSDGSVSALAALSFPALTNDSIEWTVPLGT